MIRNSNRSDCILNRLLLIIGVCFETSLDALGIIYINLDWYFVKFSECLQLYIVTPNSVFGFILNIFLHISTDYKIFEELFFRQNILHGI